MLNFKLPSTEHLNILQKILQSFNGLHYRQEYLCLSKENFENPLHAYLVAGNRIITDISNIHCFVGYSPLVFAIPGSALWNLPTENIQIKLTQKIFNPNDEIPGRDALASLSLKKINEQQTEIDRVIYYEAVRGKHRFINSAHQSVIQLYNRLYHKKPGNVFLAGNLYKQVQIAYALPRIISLITVESGNQFNLFPTDLHGPIGGHYIVSLRHQGKACEQVMVTKKILLTQVESGFYKTVYSLGKNHMQPLRSKESFPFSRDSSIKLNLPIPEESLLHRELELIDSFIHGIHQIMLFRVLSLESLKNNPSTLAHIHNLYATWRYKTGLPGNYLLR